ncbi:hypothetical protein T06_8533 [Trichinella sp. T6]|nr:hypothetical protein T06_8533 [Trichinella sp. T6]
MVRTLNLNIYISAVSVCVRIRLILANKRSLFLFLLCISLWNSHVHGIITLTCPLIAIMLLGKHEPGRKGKRGGRSQAEDTTVQRKPPVDDGPSSPSPPEKAARYTLQ